MLLLTIVLNRIVHGISALFILFTLDTLSDQCNCCLVLLISLPTFRMNNFLFLSLSSYCQFADLFFFSEYLEASFFVLPAEPFIFSCFLGHPPPYHP